MTLVMVKLGGLHLFVEIRAVYDLRLELLKNTAVFGIRFVQRSGAHPFFYFQLLGLYLLQKTQRLDCLYLSSYP